MTTDSLRRAQPDTDPTRGRFVVRGVVQGVGFRPFVARLAHALDLAGFCRNDSSCVQIEVEGGAQEIAEFAARLRTQAPALAQIEKVELTTIAPLGTCGFVIEHSEVAAGQRTLVPPDTALCADCLAELFDPADRRYLHPFITCTNCGPRLTITLDLPYDRPATTMAQMPMCTRCAAEYADPLDRRYHAQPICCHDCGPRLRMLPDAADTGDPIEAAARLIADGAVVAVKGIGGFHLAVDARNPDAVARLRERKHRPEQPFAVMVADQAAADTVIHTDDHIRGLLTSPAHPIVVAPARADAGLAAAVAPGLDEYGVMLGYAGLHQVLLHRLARGGPPPVLVMTSGNISGEPLCYTDDDALDRLGAIADAFLLHDRPIAVPVEDSVIAAGQPPVLLRRSRGHAPLPVDLPVPGDGATVLAAGAEVKNTVALGTGSRGFVSPHIGDLESLASRTAHDLVSQRLLTFHRATPALLVCDAHPGYASRAWAHRMGAQYGVPVHEVQHHHAHLASLAAESGYTEPLIGLVFDGTGYGCDASIWGGELLLLTDGGASAQRLGHLSTVRLPGGDAGVRNPIRTAAVALLDAGLDLDEAGVGPALEPGERRLLEAASRTGLGMTDTTSVGRLFDVVAAICGIRTRISYEAQAAIELEAAARVWLRDHGPDGVADLGDAVTAGGIDASALVRAVVAALASHPPAAVAAGFHDALANAAATIAASAAVEHGIDTVGLTGGVFCNRILLAATAQRLRASGLVPLVHRVVPANDGGLSLGQLLVGLRHHHSN